jgi:hypothetical protein
MTEEINEIIIITDIYNYMELNYEVLYFVSSNIIKVTKLKKK